MFVENVTDDSSSMVVRGHQEGVWLRLEPGSLSGQVAGPVSTAFWLHARVGYCRRSSADDGKAKRAIREIEHGRVMMKSRDLVERANEMLWHRQGLCALDWMTEGRTKLLTQLSQVRVYFPTCRFYFFCFDYKAKSSITSLPPTSIRPHAGNTDK
ncbi:uncharacterized protein B0T23DRAFT_397681 [Neurospora hispaniola]|uniref:Uncharacterized protein n=1 Tax=Neurospora hispaniola TaxID=588809 RepID=A0AAJ0I3L8_9PEZI|nr:hypothetical protein B0T23DRAFT_397681 [Neurospora hispaniola]